GRVLEDDTSCKGVRNAGQGRQAVQPRLRELSRHRLRETRREHSDARARADRRAVRDVPWAGLLARREPGGSEVDPGGARSRFLCPGVPPPPARQEGLERRCSMEAHTRSRTRKVTGAATLAGMRLASA